MIMGSYKLLTGKQFECENMFTEVCFQFLEYLHDSEMYDYGKLTINTSIFIVFFVVVDPETQLKNLVRFR